VSTTAPYAASSSPRRSGESAARLLTATILRHGGEAQTQRDAFAELSRTQRQDIIAFLNSLILFPPDDTASNLDPGDPTMAGFPQYGHGSIRLTMLFNDPRRIE
jgi:Di-haem oxidoreductase, putative peroxidase